MRYPLIVFDWDGTVADSAGVIVEAIQQASRDLGLAVPDRARASHVIGLGLHDSLRHAVPELPRERYAEFVGRYREHFLAREGATGIFPGIDELLGELRARGHLLAVATGKSRRGLERAFERCGIGAHFVASRCADETNPKPDPAMLRELIEELAMRPRDALMIGDTSHDLEMAASAGIDALAVTYGAHAESSLRAFGPRGMVASVQELREWLVRHA